MLSVFLHRFHIESIFYENGIIEKDDIRRNIYYSQDDIGVDIFSYLHNKMKIDTIRLSSSPLNMENLTNSNSVIVNSDFSSWIDAECCITINTWNYRNAGFVGFQLFNGKNRYLC